MKENSSLPSQPLFSLCVSVITDRLTCPRRRDRGNKHGESLLCSLVLPVTKAVLTVITSRVGDIKRAFHNVPH